MRLLYTLDTEVFSAGRVKLYVDGEFLGQVKRHNDIYVVSLEFSRDAYGKRVKTTDGLNVDSVTGFLRDGTPYFDDVSNATQFLLDNFALVD